MIKHLLGHLKVLVGEKTLNHVLHQFTDRRSLNHVWVLIWQYYKPAQSLIHLKQTFLIIRARVFYMMFSFTFSTSGRAVYFSSFATFCPRGVAANCAASFYSLKSLFTVSTDSGFSCAARTVVKTSDLMGMTMRGTSTPWTCTVLKSKMSVTSAILLACGPACMQIRRPYWMKSWAIVISKEKLEVEIYSPCCLKHGVVESLLYDNYAIPKIYNIW